MNRIKKFLESDSPVKWLFTGDSITHGAYHTLGHRDYVQMFEERLRYELDRRLDTVIRTAVSGWTTAELLKNLDNRVIQFNPDVLSIMIGMNDSAILDIRTFDMNLREIIKLVQNQTNASIFLHTPNPIITGSDEMREPNIEAFAKQIMIIAKDLDIPVIDHYTEWTNAWEGNSRRMYTWMNNGIHPNKYGHRAFAHSLFKSLDIYDEKMTCCGSIIP